MRSEWRKNGANFIDGRTEFRVWAPLKDRISLIGGRGNDIGELEKDGEFFSLETDAIGAGDRYFFKVEGRASADPASRFQPAGVSGPSMIIDEQKYIWDSEEWKGRSIEDMVIYEIHTGTFSVPGSYDGIAGKLDHIAKTGINTLELMPLSQAYGAHNWGYDGVFPFAPAFSYGSPDDLKKLIDKCHSSGIAVLLDVVYNHLGPFGCVLPLFGPYLSDRHSNQWGKGINFDSSYSNEVRNFFLGNAIYWLENFRFDGLRLDATHEIVDTSTEHFLESLSSEVRGLSLRTHREYVLIAENDRNDAKLVRERNRCGYGLDGVWSDDFHHAIHSYFTGEKNGYYSDFGTKGGLIKAMSDGIVYEGQYSRYLNRNRGNSFRGEKPSSLVVCIQNHDQVGNRAMGDRISSLVSFEVQKLSAAILLLSPYTPLLFMGQEYGESNPFLFFADPENSEQAKTVDSGRRKEFKDFKWPEDAPLSTSPEAFLNSKLSWNTVSGSSMLKLYRDLIRFRREYIRGTARMNYSVSESGGKVAVSYAGHGREILVTYLLDSGTAELAGDVVINTDSEEYGGKSSDRKILQGPGASVSIFQE